MSGSGLMQFILLQAPSGAQHCCGWHHAPMATCLASAAGGHYVVHVLCVHQLTPPHTHPTRSQLNWLVQRKANCRHNVCTGVLSGISLHTLPVADCVETRRHSHHSYCRSLLLCFCCWLGQANSGHLGQTTIDRQGLEGVLCGGCFRVCVGGAARKEGAEGKEQIGEGRRERSTKVSSTGKAIRQGER